MSNEYYYPQDCLRCLYKKYLLSVNANNNKEYFDYAKDVNSIVQNNSVFTCIPEIYTEIEHCYQRYFNDNEKYAKIKTHFNKLLLGLYDKLDEQIAKHSDPLRYALKLSLVGNYIDFAVVETIDEDKLLELIDKADDFIINEKIYDNFKNELSNSKTIIYLTDNCGEIVFDKLFIKYLKKFYSTLNITAIVKGGEIINDATMIDAKEVDLFSECKVIDNRLNATGTLLNRLDEDILDLIKNSDLIISKGQANAESLVYSGLNIYYLFLCKCDYFAKKFSTNKMDIVFNYEKNLKKEG